MKRLAARRRAGARFWCLGRTPGADEASEQWVSRSQSTSGAEINQKSKSKAEQTPSPLARDSQDGLVAYLGRSQLERGASGTVLVQAAHALYSVPCTNLLKDDASSTNAVPLSESASQDPRGSPAGSSVGTQDIDDVSVSGQSAASAFDVHATPYIYSAEHFSGGRDALEAIASKASAAALSGSHAENASVTAPSSAKPSIANEKTQNNVNTPPNSDRPRAVLQFSDGSGLPTGSIQAAEDGALETISPASAPMRPLKSEASGDMAHQDSSDTKDLSTLPGPPTKQPPVSVLLSDNMIPAALNLEQLNDLSSCSTRADFLGIARPLPVQRDGGTLPRRPLSSAPGRVHSILSSGGSQRVVMRRHTAVILMPESDDESDDAEPSSPVATSASSDGASSMSSGSSIGSALRSRTVQRRLSGVYEGHHVQLQKLRRQMGDPEEPPEDLLELMARRVFSQQGVMARVNSEGMVSTLDARSSHQTPEQQDSWSPGGLPRIRTRVASAAVASV